MPLTNDWRRQAVPIVPGITFAVFHVHPSRQEPVPSARDRVVADRYGLKILTIHRYGLYEYDPLTKKTTRLRKGLDWMMLVQR